MYDTSLCFLTATELAQKIRAGEISAVETMEAHLAQIEKVNPQVNAIVTLLPEMGMEAASKADGEFVPKVIGLFEEITTELSKNSVKDPIVVEEEAKEKEKNWVF